MNGVDGNDFFRKMCKDAQDELASGEKGWKETDNNTLLLACFGFLTNHLTHEITRKLSKPVWFFAGCVASAVRAFSVERIISGG